MTHYFLFAGELSGDLHGSHLMQALRNQNPSAIFSGVGGPYMRGNGLELLFPMESFQVMGFSDVFKHFPRLWKLFYQVRDTILSIQPNHVILIDYPGFNLRLAKALRKQGFKGKITQYICPTVWAHGKHRIQTLSSYFDLLLCIFPFEPHYFSHTSLQVKYIGNPLLESLHKHPYQSDWMDRLGIPDGQNLIALFPGSRQGEIQRHAPQQLEVAFHLKKSDPHLRFALSCAQESLHNELLHLAQQSSLLLNQDLFIIPPHYHYELMKTCQTALAKSGTVTLELALHRVPTVVHYQVSSFNYAIAKYVLRLQLPYYCIVNILGERMIFPEFVEKKIETMDLKKQLELLHFNSAQRQRIQADCEMIKERLGPQLSHETAARAIEELR